MKKNEEYIVKIIDNGFHGEGIAKIDGLVVFIPGAIKNETIKIKILKVLKNEAYGKIIEIIEKSEHRVEEDCKTHSKCGGCSLRHIKYSKTLEMKTEVVKNILNKNGLKDKKVNDCIGMEKPYNYRNKLQYPVGLDNESNPVMGVFQERSHSIIKTEECAIQDKESQEIAKEIFKFWQNNKLKVYNEKTLNGSLRHIVIRKAFKTNEIMVTLVINEKFEKEKELIEILSNKYKNIKTVAVNINNKNTNVILGENTRIIFGEGYITDELLGYKFKISPKSFYQVNPVQTEILYKTAIDVGVDAHIDPNNIALDLYCGIGTIGICASKYFKEVYGIEIVEEAIKDANENAKINNIENTKFYAGKVEDLLENVLEKNKIKPNIVFVDPPRKGLDNNTIEVLKQLKAEKIVYVSCNPATLARDLKSLQEVYEIKQITPVDMFPYTSHVECVAVLQKNNI